MSTASSELTKMRILRLEISVPVSATQFKKLDGVFQEQERSAADILGQVPTFHTTEGNHRWTRHSQKLQSFGRRAVPGTAEKDQVGIIYALKCHGTARNGIE